MMRDKSKPIPKAGPPAKRPKVNFLPTHFIARDAAKRTEEENDFMLAIERYKREKGRPFPTCSEILAIAKALGYRKVAEASPI